MGIRTLCEGELRIATASVRTGLAMTVEVRGLAMTEEGWGNGLAMTEEGWGTGRGNDRGDSGGMEFGGNVGLTWGKWGDIMVCTDILPKGDMKGK